jgi:hypothetical protein
MKNLFIIIAIAFCSCSSRPDCDDYLSQMNIKLAEKYIVLNNKSDWAIGDFTVVFRLKIGDKDLKTIKSKIQHLASFKDLEKDSLNFSCSTLGNSDKINGWKKGTTYGYEIEKAVTKSGNERYSLYLRENILTFAYNQE